MAVKKAKASLLSLSRGSLLAAGGIYGGFSLHLPGIGQNLGNHVTATPGPVLPLLPLPLPAIWQGYRVPAADDGSD